MNSKQQIKNSESGAILPLLAIAIVAIFGVVALLVDLSRGTYTVNTIQEAADSATLSAVRQFNGTEEGWDTAISAAMLALQSNPISGAEANALVGMTLNANGPMGNSTIGEQNGVRVVVARGMYWFDDQIGKRKFVSLEEGADNGNGPWLHQDFAKHIFADAVKVEVTLNSLDTSAISNAQGRSQIENLRKSSVAVSDSALKLRVFPGAIPYCQLMLNTDSNEANNHMLDTYSPKNAIGRELFFTELEGFVTGSNDTDIPTVGGSSNSLPTASLNRRHGLRRYLSQISVPTYDITNGMLCTGNAITNGTGVSCKHKPIQGLLGINGSTPGEATAADLLTYFAAADNGDMRVQLGEHFKPLREWPTGDLSNFTNIMNDFMADGTQTIDDRYIVHNDLGTRKYAGPNFPAVRHHQSDSGNNDFMRRPNRYFGSANIDLFASNRIEWPLKIGLDEFRFGLLVGTRSAADPTVGRREGDMTPVGTTYAPFINTMCNSATENLDRTNYKVRRYAVMVIAPGVEENTYNGEQVSYCDFDNQFNKQPQNSRVPWFKNEPRVVGVVHVDFIGFNFEDLSTFPGGTPRYQSTESGGEEIVDSSPAFLELGAMFQTEVDEYEAEYQNCQANANSNPNACNIEVNENIALPAEIANCFDDTGYLLFKLQVNGVSNKANQCSGKEDECDDIDEILFPAAKHACENEYEACKNQLQNQVNAMTAINAATRIPAIPGQHCLPLPTVNASNFDSVDSFEQPLSPLNPDRGCGGVRARIADDRDGEMLNTGKTWQEMTPIIVEDVQ